MKRKRLEAAGELVAPASRRRPSSPPRVRSGTSLEVAEMTWIAEGVSRATALSIPALAACRNLIVGTIVQLDLYRYRGGERLESGYLLTKPDPSTTLPATIGGTVDDLIFEARAFWLILERDGEGYPTRARWTPVADVTENVRGRGGTYSVLESYTIAGVEQDVDPTDVIRFDSPVPSLLVYGGRTIAAGVELELAARRLSGVEIPAGTLTNEGTELGDDEAADLVAAFQTSRRENGIAFLQGVKYEREALNPADLQLVEARANVATDCARLTNVPVAMISASPSGNASALLYSNLSQQLALLISNACAPHLRTIETTLSDTLPRGQSVAFDVQTFLRSDPAAAASYAVELLGAGVIDRDEARSLLGIPATPVADLQPGKV